MKNKTLNNAFPIVAAALGNKFGVKVSVGGSKASTNGKVINIPAYNLDDDSSYKDVAWGYLAHEAAHVRFTDFVVFSNAATNPVRESIVNILEDVRIEKKIQETFPGTKRTIEKMVHHLIQTGLFKVHGQHEQVHPATVLSQFLLFRLRNDILGQTALSSYADTAEDLLEDTFPVGAVTRLNGLLSEVPQFHATRDCVRLADRILRMIDEEQEKEQEKALQQQQSRQQDSDGSSSPSQPGQTDQDEDSTDTDPGDSPQDSPSQGDDSPTDQDTDEPSQQLGDSEPDNDDQDQGSVSQPSDADDQDPGDIDDSQPGQGHANDSGGNNDNSQDQDSGQLAQNLASVLSAGDDDVPDDVFDVAKDVLGSQPVNSYDENVHLPVAMDPLLNPALGNALMNKVLGNSGKIRASLQGIVQSSRRDRPVHKRSGNRIDGRKLPRLSQGDSRVFERRIHKASPNTAIHLLVDGSPSMSQPCSHQPNKSLIDLAIESAMALALALEGISGVNPAVTRFPHNDEGNVVPLLKHGEKVRLNAPKFLAVTKGSTPLDEALWYAASSVLSTREERKVIMVLTDGEPDDVDAAKAIIKRIEATGIELFGVGICFDTGHLFTRSILINDVTELRSELFRISRDLLLAA